jgi:hypothetical protein
MFSIPKPGKGVQALMVILTVSWVLFVLLSDSGWAPVAAALPMVPAAFARGALWQPATAVLVQPTQSIGGIALQVFILWFAVSSLEPRLGTRRLLVAFFGAGVAGTLATAVLTVLASAVFDSPPRLLDAQRSYLGSGSAVLGVWVAGVATLRGQVLQTAFLGRIRAEHLALGLTAVGVLLTLPGGTTHPIGELAAGAFGWWWGQRGGPTMRLAPKPARVPRPGPRFEVLEGGNENPGRSGRGWRPRQHADDNWH